MTILLHGTTRHRAERIVAEGPAPKLAAEGFSTYLESGPFLFGTPEEYACGKALAFPNEGGAAIVAVDVTDDIIALATDEYFPLSQGLVQFDAGAGLEQLRANWSTLWMEIRSVECP
ncbi:MAG: hypothetical protein L0Y72_13405 [Gemmataceae bacterium]|nr:hypothetical protein [Gemmataceae bacterium]